MGETLVVVRVACPVCRGECGCHKCHFTGWQERWISLEAFYRLLVEQTRIPLQEKSHADDHHPETIERRRAGP